MGTSYSQDQEFLKSVISATLLEDAIEWIASNMNPEDMFSESDLGTWAEENGFIKDEDE